MHKLVIIGLMCILATLFSIATINNIFSNVMAQGYDNYYGDNTSYSKYPTKDKKIACQTGQFEGFFVESLEFCQLKIAQGLQGPPGQNATEVTVNNIRDPVTNQTLRCVLNTSVDPASIDCVLPPTPEPPTCEGCFSILSEQDLEGFLEIFDQTIDSVTGQEIDINTLEDLCEFLETSTLISSSEKFLLLSTTLSSQGVSDEDEQIIIQCLRDLGTVI